jgi:hypothetical protein
LPSASLADFQFGGSFGVLDLGGDGGGGQKNIVESGIKHHKSTINIVKPVLRGHLS